MHLQKRSGEDAPKRPDPAPHARRSLLCREGSRLASRLRPAPPLGPRLRPPPRPRRPRPARASRFPGAAYEARQNGPRGPASAAVRSASGRGLPRSHRAAPAPPARAAPAGPLGPPDPGERPRLSPSTPRAFPERFRPSRFRAHAAFGSGFASPSPALGAHRPRASRLLRFHLTRRVPQVRVSPGRLPAPAAFCS